MSEKPYGIIYLTSRVAYGVTVKRYIGQHRLKNGVVDDGYLGSGKILQRAIKKYGRKSFIREVLEVCYSPKELHLAEKKWIRQLGAVESPHFYNLSEGGGSLANIFAKPVYQYDLNGNFIKEFPSGVEAAAEVGTASTCISRACRKEGKTVCGYQWRYEKMIVKPTKVGNVKKVNCYSLDGKFVRTYKSASEAGKHFGINPCLILGACRGLYIQIKNYQWRLFSEVEGDTIPPARKHKTTGRSVQKIYAKDGSVIETFEGLNDAARKNNLTLSSVAQALRNICKAGGYYWKYTDSSVNPYLEAEKKRKIPRPKRIGNSVDCLDNNGKVLRTYASAEEAAKSVGVKSSGIIATCRNYKGKTSCAGFGWRYSDPSKDIKSAVGKTKAVNCLDLEGNFIKRYESTEEAAKAVGIKRCGISNVCNPTNRAVTAGGYKWEYAS